MGIFDFFKNKTEKRDDDSTTSITVSDSLLQSLLGNEGLTKDSIMNIPAVTGCVNKISDTVAALPVRLYKKNSDGTVEEVTKDDRLRLLNHDTGDTLTPYQFKKRMVMDMYLDKGGYAYVNKINGKYRSLNYVEPEYISFLTNVDPIFKDYKISCWRKTYEGWQFVKLLRNTEDGYEGKSILDDCRQLLDVNYSTQKYEKTLVKTGGNKKGFLQATNRLTAEAMSALKRAFKNLYSNSSENVVILNDGLTFQESSNTALEMQLNENKETGNNDICKIFNMLPSILNGNATEADIKLFHESCIVPLLDNFNAALNSVLLRETEKDTYFFAFDTSDLLKGDLEKRFKAYSEAISAGWLQIDEVRTRENLPELGLEFVKLGLQDVLYFPETKSIYTPNTNKLSVMGEDPADSPDDVQQIPTDNDISGNLEEGGGADES